MKYVRRQFDLLKERILEPRKFMQVLAGPMTNADGGST